MANSSKNIMIKIKVLLNKVELLDIIDILETYNNLFQSIKAFKC